MAHPLAMPKPGQFTEQCTIIRWLKKEGELIAKGDLVYEIETDKSNMEVESFFDGTLLKILVPEGVPTPVQTVVGWIGTPGEKLPEAPPPPPVAKESNVAVTESGGQKPVAASVGSSAAAVSVQMSVAPQAPGRMRISPRAAALARRCVIDPAPVRGTGPGGRIIEKDVQAYLDSKNYASLRIAPAAKTQAAREKIDLLALRGSGEGGRITVADVERAVKEKPQPMSRMRQVIAERLTHSFTSTPHFFVTVAVDMTDLLEFRAELKGRNLPYSVTDFIMMAVTQSLQEFPVLNSSTDGKSIRWNSRVNLGLAVSLESGLVVPVIRGADELSLLELHERAKALGAKARAGKLLPDEMTGGTFTISNMGMLDVESFTAIINPGEAAILAVASTVRQPVVRGDQVAIRSIMKLTLSSDHRLVDGAHAAKFVNAIKQKLEDLEVWKRMV